MARISPARVGVLLGTLLLVTTTSYYFFVPASLRNDGEHDLHSSGGIYGIHDAEFNWCERDYVFSIYVAEVWNTATSALYVLEAVAAFRLHGDVLRQSLLLTSTMVACALTGVGSMIFHTTLNYVSQLADELPLYALIMCASLCFYTRVTKNQPGIRIHSSRRRLALCASIWWISVVCIMMFVSRAHIFHVVFRGLMTCTFSIMFLYVFWAGATASRECQDLLSSGRPQNVSGGVDASNLGHLFDLGFIFILIGVVCWILDNFFCVLLRELPVYPQLHALGWHLGTALGLWCIYQLLLVHFVLHELTHAGRVEVAITIDWLWGMPIVRVSFLKKTQ